MGACRKHSERPEKIFRALGRLFARARRFLQVCNKYCYNKYCEKEASVFQKKKIEVLYIFKIVVFIWNGYAIVGNKDADGSLFHSFVGVLLSITRVS